MQAISHDLLLGPYGDAQAIILALTGQKVRQRA